jgi:uncharacterized protein YxjI
MAGNASLVRELIEKVRQATPPLQVGAQVSAVTEIKKRLTFSQKRLKYNLVQFGTRPNKSIGAIK